MSIEITIPDPGESIHEVEIGRWHKSEGEAVDRDETVVEVETDKASLEVPAPQAGTLVKITKEAGAVVKVGDVIGRIEADGVSQGRDDEEPADESGTAETEAARPETNGEGNEDLRGQREDRREPDGEGDDHSREEPTRREARDGDGQARDGDQADTDEHTAREDEDEAAPSTHVEVEPRVMPPAMQALAEYGLRPSEVQGTGPAGRVLKEDVERHADVRPPESSARSGIRAAARSGASGGTPSPLRVRDARRASSERRREHPVTMSRLRQGVVRYLEAAARTAPAQTLIDDIDTSRLRDLIRRYAARYDDSLDESTSVVAFFVQAAVAGLREVPALNAAVREDTIVYRDYVDVNLAMHLEGRVVAPVLFGADVLRYGELINTVGDLLSRARAKRLEPEELASGTFTVRTAPSTGPLLSIPMIDPSQSGSLTFNGVRDRPAVRADGPAVRPMMYASLTYDARVVDEGDAGRFLAYVKSWIEDPAMLLLRQ